MSDAPPAGTQGARPSPGRTVLRHALTALKVGVAVALVWWLIASGQLDLRSYEQLTAASNRGVLIAIFVTQFAAFSLFIARWRGLVRAQGIPMRWAEVMGTGYQGLFTQLFVPGGVGTDGLRALHVQRSYRDRLVAGVTALLVDRISGLVSLILLGFCSSALYAWQSGDARLQPLLLVNALVFGAASAGALLLFVLPRPPHWFPASVAGALDGARNALRVYRGHKGALAFAVLLSLVGHLWMGACSYLCLWALGVTSPPFVGVVAITCALNMLRMVPITPMGLGVTDIASEHLFALIGLGMGAELQMLQRLTSMLIFAAAGVAFLWRHTPPPAGAMRLHSTDPGPAAVPQHVLPQPGPAIAAREPFDERPTTQ
jgi:uncharacterized membrane protein YbhN (UPF0104 family)